MTVRPAPGTVDPATLHEMICKKAYELFERRGCEHGHHDEDWLEAERIVCSSLEPVSELGPKPAPRASSGRVVAHRPIPNR
jgi:hypothetical protein